MRKSTLEKMQIDSTLSEVKRMAAGSLIATAGKNSCKNLKMAAGHLQGVYGSMSFEEAHEYVFDVADEADDREWGV